MNISLIISNVIRFFILIFLQIFIFNNVNISNLGVIPFVYIIVIILLPFEIPNWLLIITAFFLGLFVDIFSNTMGQNASATVLIAFFRPWILNYLAPRDGYEISSIPSIYYQGFVWFLKYTSILIVLHQFVYYFLEAFGFSNFGFTIVKTLLGSFISIIMITLSQYIVFRK